MIPFQGFIILLLYAVLGVFFFGVLYQVKLNGRELWGRPTMNVYVQMFGKFSLFIPILLLPAEILGMRFRWIEPSETQKWLAVIFAAIAMVFLILSLLRMGKYTKMGLPRKDEIKLQTSGIYAISRNPMYFGLALLATASVLFVPNPFNLASGAIGVVVHHSIILNEEKFLTASFSEQWKTYSKKVRRYI
jgi:protein-S-isoprenylcysteine O-methyltransferase Ste14